MNARTYYLIKRTGSLYGKRPNTAHFRVKYVRQAGKYFVVMGIRVKRVRDEWIGFGRRDVFIGDVANMQQDRSWLRYELFNEDTMKPEPWDALERMAK